MPNSVSEEIIYIKHRAAIGGYVTDAITGKGIPGITVEVLEKILSTLTREDGFFYFLDLEKGTYKLNILVPQEWRSRYRQTDITPIIVKVDYGQEDAKPNFDPNANVKLSPTSLHGIVTNKNIPLPKAIVKLLGSEIQTLTDDNGKFILSGFDWRPSDEDKPNEDKPKLLTSDDKSKLFTIQVSTREIGNILKTKTVTVKDPWQQNENEVVQIDVDFSPVLKGRVMWSNTSN